MFAAASVVQSLQAKFRDHLVAVALFGSAARGEADPRSDLDFLVVLRGIPKTLERRYEVYKPIHDAITSNHGRVEDVTVIDIDEEYINDVNAEINSLMLNIISDAVILHDPSGKLAAFINDGRRLIETAGLVRYKTKEGKYGWKSMSGRIRAVEI